MIACYCRVSSARQKTDSQKAEIGRWLAGSGIDPSSVEWYEDKADWCERGVRVVVVTQQIDLSGAVGRMVASVLFGLAEIESEYRRERQAAGIAVARKRGVYQGRRRGTTKAKPVRAEELRDRGLTAQEIATALGVSRRTVFRYLENPTREDIPSA